MRAGIFNRFWVKSIKNEPTPDAPIGAHKKCDLGQFREGKPCTQVAHKKREK
jgi:hypothetical protein